MLGVGEDVPGSIIITGVSVGASPCVGVITGKSVGSGVSEMTATAVGSDVGAGWLQAANNSSATVMRIIRILLGVCIIVPSH